MRKDYLKGMMKKMALKLNGLEERSHKGGRVEISEMAKIKMKLNVLEVFLQEQMEED